jgi:hypothetical protein
MVDELHKHRNTIKKLLAITLNWGGEGMVRGGGGGDLTDVQC